MEKAEIYCGPSLSNLPTKRATRRKLPGGRLACVLLVLSTAVGLAAQPVEFDKLLKEGAAFHDRADYAHSVPILRKATRLVPRNYLANMLLGVDLLRSGHAAEAIAPLQVAVATHPKDTSTAEILAKAATEAGDFALAAEVLQEAVERSGGSVKAIQTWAGYCLERFRILAVWQRSTKRGEGVELRVEAASHEQGGAVRESLLQESADDNPDQRGIWGELGIAQLQRRERNAVETSLKEAQKREPEGAETLQLQALLAAVEGKWPEAERLLLALGARSPAQLHRVLLSWLRVLIPGPEIHGVVWDCLRDAATKCSLTTGEAQGGKSLGNEALYAAGRWEQLAALPPPATSNDAAWLWRGVALAEMGNCQRAIPSLERGIKAEEEAAGFWLGVCYASEAERAASLISAAGDTVALDQLRGDVLLQLGRNAVGAEAQYAQALKLRPNDPQLLERSAEAYIGLANLNEARQFALAALAIDPQLVSALRTLVQIDMSERKYDEVIAPLKKLEAIDPRDTWVRVELGTAYVQLEHPDEALRYLEPALKAGYPDNKGALHAMMAKALRRVGREQEAKQAAVQAARLADASQKHTQAEDNGHN